LKLLDRGLVRILPSHPRPKPAPRWRRPQIAMAISGHRTEAIFERYNIETDDDLRHAVEKLASYVSELPVALTVVPLPRIADGLARSACCSAHAGVISTSDLRPFGAELRRIVRSGRGVCCLPAFGRSAISNHQLDGHR